MSDRSDIELDSFVTRRLVTGIDTLPVPAGAGRRPPRAVTGAGHDLLLIFAVALLLLVLPLSWGPATQAVADAARLIQRMINGGAYVGYYVDLAQRDDRGLAVQRIMFAAGQLPGMRSVPEVVGPDVEFTGPGPLLAVDAAWTDDGVRVLLWAGPRIYVGDRRGRVQQVADLGADHVVLRAGWVGSDQIVAVLRAPAGTADQRRWTARIRVGAPAEALRPAPYNMDPTTSGPVSPDGRWLSVIRGIGPCNRYSGTSGLYEIERDRIVDLVDHLGRKLHALGWTRDGRVVSAFCDEARGTMDLFVSPPETAPATPLATVSWSLSTPIGFDAAHERILVAPRGGTAPARLLGITLDGRQVDVGAFPAFAPDDGGTRVQIRSVSRDGRYLTFVAVDANDIDRTGLIELATGQVTYACSPPRECSHLTLR